MTSYLHVSCFARLIGDDETQQRYFSSSLSTLIVLSLVASRTLQLTHGDFVVGLVVVYFYGPANMTHKLSSACAEMILSYHLSPQQICFTHKLETVTSRFCGFVVVFLFVWVVFLFGFVLVLFLLLVLCVSVFVLWNVRRTLDYVSVLYQFTFAATTAAASA